MKLSDSLKSLKSYIVYYPEIAKMLGGVKEAIFLLNLIGWHSGKEIYKARQQVYDETGLSFREQEAARKRLKDLGVLKERYARLEHVLYFDLDLNILDEMYNNYTISCFSRSAKNATGQVRKTQLAKCEKRASDIYTDSTTDSTTDNKIYPEKQETKKAQKSIRVTEPQIQEIFGFWKTELDHPKARLDKKRAKIIKEAFNMGYSAEELKNAISGCKKSEFNMGQNENKTVYDDIGLILRDSVHVERFIGFHTGKGKKVAWYEDLDATAARLNEEIKNDELKKRAENGR